MQGFEGGEVSAEGHPVLAGDEVRYAGQPVAAVLAESRALAEDAAELIEVDYEPLDPVLDARSSDVTMSHWHKVSGDVDGAFESAAHVVRASHALPRLAPVPMEPRGAIASYDEADDMLTVWVSAQDSHRQLAGLAQVLDRPEESIHVIVPDVGGAFGSKGAPAPETMLVAAAAMTDRPHRQVGGGPRGELRRLLPGARHGGRRRAGAGRRRRRCSPCARASGRTSAAT